MRIDLMCPFKDKDEAKLLGARWDAARRVWYIVDVEDLTPFMRWIPRGRPDAVVEPPSRLVTLATYLGNTYRSKSSCLTHAAAVAFGVPWPLEAGWAKRYADRTIPIEMMGQLAIAKNPTHKMQNGKVVKAKMPKTTGGKFVPLCNCDALPWEECEHTPAYLAMLDACVKAATSPYQMA